MKTQIIRRVMDHMGWLKDKAETWYNLANPLLGGVSPRTLVELDQGHKVINFINGASLVNTGYKYKPRAR